MKKFKISLLIILSLLTMLSLFACNDDTPKDTNAPVVYHTVTFDTTGGSDIAPVIVQTGYALSEPARPMRSGYIFAGWDYSGKAWSFESDKVTSDITLSATWIDAGTVYDCLPIDGGVCVSGVKRTFEVMDVPSVISGQTVLAIGDGVFEDTNSNKTNKITVPDTVTSIGKNAFRNCEDVEIKINGALTFVGEAAFAGCNKLSAVAFGDGITTIPPQAFGSCASLKKIALPDSVTLIDENAFEECTSLSTLTLGASLAEIADSAFVDCDALENVSYNGSEADFDKIQIKGGNTALKTAQITFSKD